MNLSRSLGAIPRALPFRSRLWNSLPPWSSSHLPVFTWARRRPMMIGRCSMPDRDTDIRRRRTTCIATASSPAHTCRQWARFRSRRDRADTARTPRITFFGSSSLPVLFAGQCSVQRPHSTQEKACSATIFVMSLPVSIPKSSSPTSGGMRLKLPRDRKIVAGLSSRCRCFVCGINGRNTSSASVCSHQLARAAGVPSVKQCITRPDTSPSAPGSAPR